MEHMPRATRIVGFLLLVLLAVAPIPYGSNRDWSWSPLALAVGILLLGNACVQVAKPERSFVFSTSRIIAGVAMTVVVAWAFMQTAMWSPIALPQDSFASLGDTLGQRPLLRISIDDERTLTAILKLLTYAGIFWIASCLAKDSDYARRLCWTLVGAAVFVTMYGWVMQVMTRSCVVLTTSKPPFEHGNPCTFSGTFINSGNYSTFAGIACVICVAYIHYVLLRIEIYGNSARDRWRARLLAFTGLSGLALAALVILFGGVVYSASRSGLLSLVMAIVAMTVITNMCQGRLKGAGLSSIAAVGALTLVTLIVAGEEVVGRFLDLFTSGDTDRVGLFAMTAEAIGLRPWTGWGLGSFEALYSLLQYPTLLLAFDKAHNVYLENASDLGIAVSILIPVAILSIATRCIMGLNERSRDSWYAASAVGATAFVAIQSTVDFGIQIPAVAVSFSALLGVGWAQSWSSRRLK
jgi:hypothetical protein